mgnify:CR=1 FL=1
MYTVFAIMFLLGVLMIGVGLLGRLGTSGISEVDSNAATAFGMLVIFSFLIVNFSSASALLPVFEGILGGIPYLEKIADYGSLHNVFTQDPMGAAASFCDVVIMATLISLLNLMPWRGGRTKEKGQFLVKCFVGVMLSLLSLLLLNYVIKETIVYQWIVAVIGTIISIISIGTIPFTLIAFIKKNRVLGIGVLGILLAFSKSKIVGIMRDAFLKAIVFVFGIWILEDYFGDLATSASWIFHFLVAFGPVVVLLIGVSVLLKTLKTNR